MKKLLSILTLFYLSQPAMASDKTLDVGLILRFTDRYNASVNHIYRGILVAQNLFESENPQIKVSFHKFEHKNLSDGVYSAGKAALKKGLKAVIGGENSDEALILGALFEKNHVVFVSPTASSPVVTQGRKYVFRACFSDEKVGTALAKYTSEKLKVAKLGVLHNVSTPYTDFLARKFLNSFQELSPKIQVLHQKVIKKEVDYSSIISDFQKAGVSHVALLSYDSDLIRFFTQSARVGYFPVYIGSDGWGSNSSIHKKMVLESPSGHKFVGYRNNYWREKDESSLRAKMQKVYRKMYSDKINAWVAIGFDTAWLLFHAMKTLPNQYSPEQLQESLRVTKNLPLTTTNRFSFVDGDNSPQRDMHIYKISDKGVVYDGSLHE